MIQERKKIILDEENLIWAKDQVRNMKRLSLRSFGVREERIYRERLEKSDRKIARIQYIEKHNSRQIERCQEALRIKTCVLSVKELSSIYRKVSTAKGSRWIEVAIEKLLSIHKVS